MRDPIGPRWTLTYKKDTTEPTKLLLKRIKEHFKTKKVLSIIGPKRDLNDIKEDKTLPNLQIINGWYIRCGGAGSAECAFALPIFGSLLSKS